LTGAGFAVFFWFEVVANVRTVPVQAGELQGFRALALIWTYHVIFLTLLIALALFNHLTGEVPLRLTIPGTLLGILGGTLAPWPWPAHEVQPWPDAAIGQPGSWDLQEVLALPAGLQPWPAGTFSIAWLQPGTWQLGLFTALTGALVGTGLIRLIRRLFSWAFEREAIGLGIADQMMMVGAFLGWQSVFLVFGLAFLLVVVEAVVASVSGRTVSEFPFAVHVALAAAAVALLGRWMAPGVQPTVFLVLGTSLIFPFVLRMLRSRAAKSSPPE
jgi:leader peptidase (prepilin peptidase)/N-methyltransferase